MAVSRRGNMTTTHDTQYVRLLRGGLIPVPPEFVESLGIDEHTTLQVTRIDGVIVVLPLGREASGGSPGLKALYEHFAPVREEILARGISEEEVNADIDAALAAARAEKRRKQR
jgi:hypothetical protein